MWRSDEAGTCFSCPEPFAVMSYDDNTTIGDSSQQSAVDNEGGDDALFSSSSSSSSHTTKSNDNNNSHNNKQQSEDAASSNSSVGWNPDDDDGDDFDNVKSNDNDASEAASHSSIRSSTNENDSSSAFGGWSANGDEEEEEETNPSPPIQSVRYVMLGAPTLLHRLAPKLAYNINRRADPSTTTSIANNPRLSNMTVRRRPPWKRPQGRPSQKRQQLQRTAVVASAAVGANCLATAQDEDDNRANKVRLLMDEEYNDDQQQQAQQQPSINNNEDKSNTNSNDSNSLLLSLVDELYNKACIANTVNSTTVKDIYRDIAHHQKVNVLDKISKALIKQRLTDLVKQNIVIPDVQNGEVEEKRLGLMRENSNEIDESDEQQHQQQMYNKSMNRGKRLGVTGWNIFHSEFMKQNAATIPFIAVATTTTMGGGNHPMISCSKLASKRWKEMSIEDKAIYKQKAKTMNESSKESTTTSTEQQMYDKRAAYNIFIAEYKSKHDKKTTNEARKEGGIVWKSMSNDEKHVYNQKARDIENIKPPPRPMAAPKKNGLYTLRSEIHNHWKVCNPTATTIEKQQSMITCCKEASLKWNSMTEEEKGVYHEKAIAAVAEAVTNKNGSNNMSRLNHQQPGVKRRRCENSSSFSRNDQQPQLLLHADKQHSEYSIPLHKGTSYTSNTTVISDHRAERSRPTTYGNCLLALHCPPCTNLIIHPAGEDLSFVTMSTIALPRGDGGNGGSNQQADIGGRVLQLLLCGTNRTLDKSKSFRIIARTSQYCSVIKVKPTKQKTFAQEDDDEEDEDNNACPEYHMRVEHRIDFRMSNISVQPSYLPVQIACDSKITNSFFTSPSFVVLCRDDEGRTNTIQRVVLGHELVVKSYSFDSSLADISLIEYCSDNRMSLWAAARSIVMPKLSYGFHKGRSGTPTGYGHSLYRIDLMNNTSSFVWSPSHAAYLIEGFHSINGIMSDTTNDNILWISSSSAGKVWALDIRYKSPKVVVSWSLPPLSDGLRSRSSPTGIYGGGVLFSQPLSSLISSSSSPNKYTIDSIQKNIQTPVMFSVKKDPFSTSLSVYQFPCTMPRFATRPLESAGFQHIPKTTFDVACIARSAIFPLPDVSGDIFNVGIATFQCSSTTCLRTKQLDQLGYDTAPAKVVYVITMTCIGDLYCHSLLETNGAEETKAKLFVGLPVGTRAIPFPGDVEAETPVTTHLRISPRNEFPIPSNAITPYIVRDAKDCSFMSYDIENILNQTSESETLQQNVDTSTGNDTFHDLHSGVNVHYSIKRSTPKFGIICSSKTPQPSSLIKNHTTDQSFPSSIDHTVAVAQTDEDVFEYEFGSHDDTNNPQNREMHQGILMSLKSGYYVDEKALEQNGVKNEWDSDDGSA